MQNITKKSLAEFIMAQPDDRQVDFMESNVYPIVTPDFCGCLLVHYAQEILKITKPFTCGMREIRDYVSEKTIARLDTSDMSFEYHYFVPPGIRHIISTYGEMKPVAQEYLSSL